MALERYRLELVIVLPLLSSTIAVQQARQTASATAATALRRRKDLFALGGNNVESHRSFIAAHAHSNENLESRERIPLALLLRECGEQAGGGDVRSSSGCTKKSDG